MEEKTHQNSENEKDSPTARDRARDELQGAENIEEMRKRLYARGKEPEKFGRTNFEQRPQTDVATNRNEEKIEKKEEVKTNSSNEIHSQITRQKNNLVSIGKDVVNRVSQKSSEKVLEKDPAVKTKTSKKSYRMKLVLGGLGIFVAAMLFSILTLFVGNPSISGENISIDISDDQFTIGGGEEFSFQIAVSNQNVVPIESATLIINYPPGTQSAENEGEELFTKRIQLNIIDTGEVVNVPAKAIIFGEENEDKTITAAVEYRVQGSNATFFKEADPLTLKISSSPISLHVDSVDRISSGQEIEFELTVISNSPNPLSDILVKASYPFGFDFSSSDPDTVSGQDTWRIEKLEPEEEKKINIKGIVVGKQDEDRVFVFSAGVPNERDTLTLASVFSKIIKEVAMEDPFLGIDVEIGGENDETVVIQGGSAANTTIRITNTQDDTLYDGVVTAKLTGNALDEITIQPELGFYDSIKNVITWDSVDVARLREIQPGGNAIVSFNLLPEKNIPRTPEIGMEITVKGQRVYEDRVPQEIVGSVTRTVRIESQAELSSEALYSVGPFENTGPIPPVAEKITQYTLDFEVENGSNDITSAVMTAVLPQYVTWLDLKTPNDNIVYDSHSRTITWSIGDMDANAREEAAVQITFVPSLSQVGKTPILLETQRLRATDRFTGTVIRAESEPLSTGLTSDPEVTEDDGRVEED